MGRAAGADQARAECRVRRRAGALPGRPPDRLAPGALSFAVEGSPRGGRLRGGRLAAALLSAAILLAAAGCRSPNRGVWSGTFDGSVSGTVTFRINARGTRLTGSLDGATRDGQPFQAKMKGSTRDEHFYATFEGTSRWGLYPVGFTGLMRGRLAAGEGSGDWTAELTRTGRELAGGWQVEQQR